MVCDPHCDARDDPRLQEVTESVSTATSEVGVSPIVDSSQVSCVQLPSDVLGYTLL